MTRRRCPNCTPLHVADALERALRGADARADDGGGPHYWRGYMEIAVVNAIIRLRHGCDCCGARAKAGAP